MAAIGVITANVNGIRAAARRGGLTWLVQQEPDVLCLQGEASDTQLLKALADAGFGDWHVAHIECSARDARTSRWRAAGPYTWYVVVLARQGLRQRRRLAHRLQIAPRRLAERATARRSAAQRRTPNAGATTRR